MSAGFGGGGNMNPWTGQRPTTGSSGFDEYNSMVNNVPSGYEWNPLTQGYGRTPSAAGGRAGQALTGLEQAAPDFFTGLKAFGQYTSGGGGPFAKVAFPNPGTQGPPFPGVGVGGGPNTITSGGQGPLGGATSLPGSQDASNNPALAGLLKSLGGGQGGR